MRVPRLLAKRCDRVTGLRVMRLNRESIGEKKRLVSGRGKAVTGRRAITRHQVDQDGNKGENEAYSKVTVNKAIAMPKDAAFLLK